MYFKEKGEYGLIFEAIKLIDNFESHSGYWTNEIVQGFRLCVKEIAIYSYYSCCQSSTSFLVIGRHDARDNSES